MWSHKHQISNPFDLCSLVSGECVDFVCSWLQAGIYRTIGSICSGGGDDDDDGDAVMRRHHVLLLFGTMWCLLISVKLAVFFNISLLNTYNFNRNAFFYVYGVWVAIEFNEKNWNELGGNRPCRTLHASKFQTICSVQFYTFLPQEECSHL